MARILLLSYVGYVAVLFFMQRTLVFSGSQIDIQRGATVPVPNGGTRHWIETDVGAVEAWFFPPEGDQPAPVLVVAHGNAELIDNWVMDSASFTRSGIGVFLVEYPGYGHSEGEPSRKMINKAFDAGYDWLIKQPQVDSDRVVGVGRSLGGGVISDLALSRPIRALILQSTFTSLSTLAWERTGFPGFFIRDAFSPRNAIATYDGPVLLFHGVRDKLIPFTHAERIAEVRPEIVLVRLACAHNDCPPKWSEFVEHVEAFLFINGLIEGTGNATSDRGTGRHLTKRCRRRPTPYAVCPRLS